MLPNLLYLVHRVPYPPDKGERIRAFHLLRFLARRSKVHLICFADEPVEQDHVSALKLYCDRLEIVPVDRWLRWARAAAFLGTGKSATQGAFSSSVVRTKIHEWTRNSSYRAVLASSSGMADYLRMPELAGAPAVVDLIDLDSQKWHDYAASSQGIKRWIYRLEGTRLRRWEREIARWAKALTVVSQAEAELYRVCCGEGPVFAVENGVDTDYFQAGAHATTPSCVFVGALDYRPNVEGVSWFCREVWPLLRQVKPNAQLSIVGRRPVPAVERLGGIPGVTVIGQVPDVRPYVESASVVVAPLRIARGIQNKVLEALAMAKAVVASPQALEGLKVVTGCEAISAVTPAEWVIAIRELWDDPELRVRLGVAGRQFVEEHHSWEKCLRPFERILSIAGPDVPVGKAQEASVR